MKFSLIISRVRIRNFRSIVDETIDLEQYNCFVGKNDSGKSNVLKALNLFFNNMTDIEAPLDFDRDYSKYAKRGTHDAKEIIIEVDVNIPETYKDSGVKTWKKVWRKDSTEPVKNNLNELFSARSRATTVLKRIKYYYIPAIKSNAYFRHLLSQVYSSMTETADKSLSILNENYSMQLQALTKELTTDIGDHLNMRSAIEMPKDLKVLFRDLTFVTEDRYITGIDLSHRGDGIKARHIPAILRYIQRNDEKNKPKNAIVSSYIWGFEEPENGVEFLSCFEMAHELIENIDERQLLITTHSPAFYSIADGDGARCFFVPTS